MYQLGEKKGGKYSTPMIVTDSNVVVQNTQRSCTDIVCLIIYILFFGSFVGLLAYGLITGSPRSVFAVHNSSGERCDTTSQFRYGYFPDPSNLKNAVCLEKCPTANTMQTPCLIDKVNCLTSPYTNPVATFTFDFYCVPDLSVSGTNISLFFDYSAYESWVFDLQKGYLVLVGAALAAMICSLIFLLVVRCCAGFIVWVAIAICCAGMEVIGVFFLLQAKGVHISPYITDQLTTVNYNSLLIIGSSLIGGGVLFILLAICLRSRISMGSKAVEMGAIFLFQNCFMIILPITQAIFVCATLAAIIVGGVSLYSLGSSQLIGGDAISTFSFTIPQMVMMGIFLASGLWSMFWFHGCNHFTLCSAVSIWYFNNESQYEQGNPFCDSFGRLLRYHIGSVALTSLINGIFFVIKLIAQIFSFEVKEEDNRCTALCLKCLNLFFCVFRIFLRFLSDGTYVQIAVFGNGYCSSTFKAFNLMAENSLKIGITDGISIFFTVLGIFGISIGVAVSAYFACIEIKMIAELLNNPLIVTIVSGMIAFVIASIYLSMIDLSAQSVMQCYLIDHEHYNGRPRHARSELKEAMLVNDQ